MELHPTNCFICSRALTDAVSVDSGIGPICSRKFYAIDIVPTEAQVMLAVGVVANLLVKGILDDETVDALLATKDKPREFCNLLLKFLSTQYKNDDLILAVVPAFRAMGFEALADKVEKARNNRVLVIDGEQYFLAVKFENNYSRAAHALSAYGKQAGGPKGFGNRTGFWIAADKLKYVRPILCHFEPGSYLFVEDEKVVDRDTLEPLSWGEMKAEIKALDPAVAVPVCRIERIGDGKLAVWTPYNQGFVDALKKLPYKARSWNPAKKCWQVDTAYTDRVVDLITANYGEAPVEC